MLSVEVAQPRHACGRGGSATGRGRGSCSRRSIVDPLAGLDRDDARARCRRSASSARGVVLAVDGEAEVVVDRARGRGTRSAPSARRLGSRVHVAVARVEAARRTASTRCRPLRRRSERRSTSMSRRRRAATACSCFSVTSSLTCVDAPFLTLGARACSTASPSRRCSVGARLRLLAAPQVLHAVAQLGRLRRPCAAR